MRSRLRRDGRRRGWAPLRRHSRAHPSEHALRRRRRWRHRRAAPRRREARRLTAWPPRLLPKPCRPPTVAARRDERGAAAIEDRRGGTIRGRRVLGNRRALRLLLRRDGGEPCHSACERQRVRLSSLRERLGDLLTHGGRVVCFSVVALHRHHPRASSMNLPRSRKPLLAHVSQPEDSARAKRMRRCEQAPSRNVSGGANPSAASRNRSSARA